MRALRNIAKVFALCVGAAILPGVALAESAEDEIRRAGEIETAAWNNRDIDALIGGGWTRGFGFRTIAARTDANYTPETVRSILTTFFDSLDHYRIIPGETTILVDGDIALTWGFHTEEIKHKDRLPETYRVRSSATMKKNADGNWQTIMSHRDIQPFDENGGYIPEYSSP